MSVKYVSCRTLAKLVVYRTAKNISHLFYKINIFAIGIMGVRKKNRLKNINLYRFNII